MPYINIRLGAMLDETQKQELYKQTTSLMNTIMRKRREVTVVHIHESSPSQWSTNGVQLSVNDATSVYVDIKVTQGTNTPEEKKEMIAQTITMLQEIVGTIQEACYVVIDDIPGDSWGYNGKTQAMRALL
ncbi:MAG: tautomerase family protein [Gammaproteobacteria bacterium]|nr:tautomerase family protein [Gammaproteobacteria bacterium]